MKNQIVLTDAYTMNPGDLDFQPLHKLAEVHSYAYTAPADLVNRIKDATIIICNKTKITREIMERSPRLKCICVSATGFNNIDVKAAVDHGIVVCNVKGYSTQSVAQHVFAMMSALQNRVIAHNRSVQGGKWSNCRDFSYTLHPIHDFAGKTFGIYGFGAIGQQVGKIAQAYGMHVIAVHKHPERDKNKGAEFTDWDTLLAESDYLSLHAPLSESNKHIINCESLAKMKNTAILINTGRGGLIDESALREALLEKEIQAAALDVLSSEPPPADHPLFGLENCLITPHIAWASVESRQTLLTETISNIKAFLNGEPRNQVN